jgi:hypothetical protein
MKINKQLVIAALAAVAFSGLPGCEREGPAESAGEAIDEAVEDAGEVMEDAGEAAEETVEKMEGATQ